MKIINAAAACGRRTTALAVSLLALSTAAAVAEPSGELVILNWLGGSEFEAIQALEKAFMAKYPQVTVSEVPVTWSGDARSGIRTSLMGGEEVDLLINGWPAFRKELVDAGLGRPLEDAWATNGWSTSLSDAWRELGSVGGVPYAIPYTYGYRSGFWYRLDTLAKVGLDAVPPTLDALIASFPAFTAQGITPLAMPAKSWAQAETFETLYVRMNGIEAAQKLINHEIPWTDESVKAVFHQWAVLINEGCCADVTQSLGTEWDNAADAVLKNGDTAFLQMGMWVNGRARTDYGLVPGTDYSIAPFPAMGLGHDDTAIVDAKEFVAISTGSNPEAADAFLDFVASAEGANIMVKSGQPSPSLNADVTQYDPAMAAASKAIEGAKVISVIGDQLPGDLADEYRVQIQKFLQAPTSETIDAVTAAIEAKAEGLY